MRIDMCPRAGGNWNNGANAGVWALVLNNNRSNTNNSSGFRADSATPNAPQGDGGAKGCAVRRAGRLVAKWVCFGVSGRETERHAGDFFGGFL